MTARIRGELLEDDLVIGESLKIGRNTVPTLGSSIITGPNTDIEGPHLVSYLESDLNYPTFQLVNWTHDDIQMNFDMYFDGTNLRSSDAGSNAQINKKSDSLVIRRSPGATPGNTLGALSDAILLDLKNGDFQLSGKTKWLDMPLFTATTTAGTDITGDGTPYKLATFTTDVVNIGSHLNTTTGIFTAPVNGQYFFNVIVALDQLTTSHTITQITLIFSGGNNRQLWDLDGGNITRSNSDLTLPGGGLLTMAATDTCYVQVQVSGSTKTVDIESATFEGWLYSRR